MRGVSFLGLFVFSPQWLAGNSHRSSKLLLLSLGEVFPLWGPGHLSRTEFRIMETESTVIACRLLGMKLNGALGLVFSTY